QHPDYTTPSSSGPAVVGAPCARGSPRTLLSSGFLRENLKANVEVITKKHPEKGLLVSDHMDHVLCDVPAGDLEAETPTLRYTGTGQNPEQACDRDSVTSKRAPLENFSACASQCRTPPPRIHDVTGRPVVQWEGEVPGIQVARLRGCRDAAKSVTELHRNWRRRKCATRSLG
ncbi:LOW QUALITY PROTEIN: hypothetical protein U0070_024884, partial [Myodes glareolus]